MENDVTPIIELENVSFTYDKITVLEEVNVTVQPRRDCFDRRAERRR